MNVFNQLSMNLTSTNMSTKLSIFRPMCRFATHWPNAFDESLAECIDIRLIFGRMHSANVFFVPMCLLRSKVLADLSVVNRLLYFRVLHSLDDNST